MSQSSFGKKFVVTTWGESHGKAIGAVLDGCPAGLSLCEEDIQVFLDRRKPGQSRYTTARKEGDLVEILSGVFEGKTTGTPISLLIRNTDQRSRDYGNIACSYRPGHADFTFEQKYGFHAAGPTWIIVSDRVYTNAKFIRKAPTVSISGYSWSFSAIMLICTQKRKLFLKILLNRSSDAGSYHRCPSSDISGRQKEWRYR